MAERREFHPPHIYEDNTCYLLTASTSHHQHLLDTHTKRTIFRNTLKDVVKKRGVRLYAWVILANHYHLLLALPSDGSLATFLQALHSQSAQRLNRFDAVRGRTVWYQYWDRFPRDEKDFWSYFNYIHINPLKHGYVQAAPDDMVGDGEWKKPQPARLPDIHERLVAYPYSSYAQYSREQGVEWLTDLWLRYPIRASLADLED